MRPSTRQARSSQRCEIFMAACFVYSLCYARQVTPQRWQVMAPISQSQIGTSPGQIGISLGQIGISPGQIGISPGQIAVA